MLRSEGFASPYSSTQSMVEAEIAMAREDRVENVAAVIAQLREGDATNAKIDELLAALSAKKLPTLSADQAAEQIANIAGQNQDAPSDIWFSDLPMCATVRRRIEQILNRTVPEVQDSAVIISLADIKYRQIADSAD